MAHTKDTLEQQTAISEDPGYGTPTVAYDEEEWEQQKVKAWPRQLHIFGKRQNQINLGGAARMRALEIQNRALEIQIQRLEEQLESLETREKKILGRIAAEMDTMQAEINRLRLSTQLNSNAVDRLMKAAEPEEEPEESQSEDE